MAPTLWTKATRYLASFFFFLYFFHNVQRPSNEKLTIWSRILNVPVSFEEADSLQLIFQRVNTFKISVQETFRELSR